jgi:2-polyprenyl-6-methoxyphenol hydroxylase-like FAD-dependent oxidoreductase
MAVERTPVLIAGAGPAGLALAIELGSRGVPCHVIERQDRVGHAPRAKTTHTRTREHLRRWGIADKLAAVSPFGIDYPSDVVFVTRLGGHALTRLENAFNCAPEPDPHYSEHAQWVPQYRLEEVLRAHAQSLPSVTFSFNRQLVGARQVEGGVRSRIQDLRTGGEVSLESDFLVGADGARSVVRDIIGAKMEGVYGLSRNYNIVFRAPGLAEAHAHGRAIMYWQVNGDAPSLIGPMDTGDRWFFMPTGVPEGFSLTDAQAAALIRKATGIDLPYEILSTDEWVASRFIADRYRDGPIFLTGDACHLHPPFGGYGMNMGIADSVDLGWKLAAVIQGWGGPALLDSYERERRPVHRMVIDEAVANHAVLGNQLWRDGLEDETAQGEALRAEVGAVIAAAKRREFKSLGIVLGYRYEGSPVIAHETAPPPTPPPLAYVPSAVPGGLAPHMWLADGRSLYDRFGAGFTLLVTEAPPPAEIARARTEAAELGIPLEILEIENPALHTLYVARYALIRPDQHVAWRGDAWPGRELLVLAAGRAVTAALAPLATAPANAAP